MTRNFIFIKDSISWNLEAEIARRMQMSKKQEINL
jgi:hypothetical protein